MSQRVNTARKETTPRLVTMKQAAQLLSVSYWTIRYWVDVGKLRAVRLPGDGRLVRIEVSELDRIIEDGRG